MTVIEILNQYGFATVSCLQVGLYILYTLLLHKRLHQNSKNSPDSLLDKIRRLDNDLIRIKTKLNTILTVREQEKFKKKDD
ncbi:MAG: hypothetical protein CM15mV25_1380 [uncultured marine virus]|nr:MAG: hypothetical protein CM15mV25_1380 [uncultured marine virus]